MISLGSSKNVLRGDINTNADAFIANVDTRPGDQLLHVTLRLVAERASEHVFPYGRPLPQGRLGSPPNGWRLSAERRRCSRGLGGTFISRHPL